MFETTNQIIAMLAKAATLSVCDCSPVSCQPGGAALADLPRCFQALLERQFWTA
jgi:hypothetical protein